MKPSEAKRRDMLPQSPIAVGAQSSLKPMVGCNHKITGASVLALRKGSYRCHWWVHPYLELILDIVGLNAVGRWRQREIKVGQRAVSASLDKVRSLRSSEDNSVPISSVGKSYDGNHIQEWHGGVEC